MYRNSLIFRIIILTIIQLTLTVNASNIFGAHDLEDANNVVKRAMKAEDASNRRSALDSSDEISQRFGQDQQLLVAIIPMREYKKLYAALEKSQKQALKLGWEFGFNIGIKHKHRKLRAKKISRSGDLEDVIQSEMFGNEKTDSRLQ